jgi:hypothetical protein
MSIYKRKKDLNVEEDNNKRIILLLEDIDTLKFFYSQNSFKLDKNFYIYLLYCFKFLLFRNFFHINFFSISYFYQKYLYFNINESRFYYLLYYLLLNNFLFNFIEIIFYFNLKLEAVDSTYDISAPPIIRKKLE